MRRSRIHSPDRALRFATREPCQEAISLASLQTIRPSVGRRIQPAPTLTCRQIWPSLKLIHQTLSSPALTLLTQSTSLIMDQAPPARRSPTRLRRARPSSPHRL